MKLELKHLAPYLPYGLRIKREMGMDYKARILIMEGLSENMIEHADIGYNGFPEHNTNIDSNLYKPIFRPLSDLTKEIEVNGEKFVPLVELAKIAFPKANKYDTAHDFIDLGHGYSFHIDKKEMSFDCRVGYNGDRWDRNCYVPNQLQLFQKLFEWHFDVFNLIPAGLAIDINTLQK